MSRNGKLGARFTAEFIARTFPRTGITLKMLETRTGISDATLARYRNDEVTIPGFAIARLDGAFTTYGFPGFLAGVHGCLPAQESPAARIATEVLTGPALPVNPAAGGDLCWWATHEGTLHGAPRGHGEFVRAYVGLAPDTDADPRRFALEHLGWLAVTRFSDGRLRLDGAAELAAPEAVQRIAAWLEQQDAATMVEGAILGTAMPADAAAAHLRGLDQPPAPSPAWRSERIAPAGIADDSARALWRQLHDTGIERAHFLESADRLGVIDRCSLFLVEGTGATSLHVGTALRVDRTAVLGRDLGARRDQAYAAVLRHDLLQACREEPMAMRMRRAAGGGYDRIVFTKQLAPTRWEALSMSSGIQAPAGFEPLR